MDILNAAKTYEISYDIDTLRRMFPPPRGEKVESRSITIKKECGLLSILYCVRIGGASYENVILTTPSPI